VTQPIDPWRIIDPGNMGSGWAPWNPGAPAPLPQVPLPTIDPGFAIIDPGNMPGGGLFPRPSGPSEPSTPWGPYPWEHQPQPDRPSTPWGPYPWEQNPAAPAMPGPIVGGSGGSSGSGGSTAPDAPASQAFDTGKFLMWIGALAVLWLILTSVKEAGYPQFAYGMAGLILFGALLTLGPKAIENAQQIFK
jgi:hypothetical protein